MNRQTYDINFYCRSAKANRLGLAPIEVSISINGKRVFATCPMKQKPDEFKADMASKKSNTVKSYCDAIRKKLDAISEDMIRENIEVTAANLKLYFQKGGVKQTYALKDLFAEYLSILEKRKGKDLSEDTYNRYVKTTKMFMEYNNLVEDTPAKNISLQEMLNYQASLNQKLDPATSCNYLQKIKSIFKYAFETGKIPANPCYGLKIDKGVKDKVLYLTNEELNKIETHKFENDRLQKIADIFIFSCYTGLAWGDIKSLSKGDIQKNEYGQLYIDKQRLKTKVRFCAILLGPCEEILKKYDYSLPIKSGQKTNEYLKEIGDLCGIDKSLHFHMARHTCAAILLNYRPAIPNETILRIMGWSNEKQLRHYARMFNSTVFEDIDKAFGEIKPVKTKKVSTKQIVEQEQECLDDEEIFRRNLGI